MCGHICPSLCGERCVQKCVECERVEIKSCIQIELHCQHTFDLELLDRHNRLQDVYAIESDGHIMSLALSKEFGTAPTCPTCLAPITDVRRYAAGLQIKALPDNIDRMIAKMGRKLNAFEEGLTRKVREMDMDFAGFCRKIRPSPMAAKVNQRLVWERGESFMEVQRKVTDFRGKNKSRVRKASSCAAVLDLIVTVDDVVKPFQANAVEVESFIGRPDIFTSPNFSFDLRYDLLFLRIRLAILQEALRMSEFLKPLNDPSQQIQALAQGLRTLTSQESVRNVIVAEEAIGKCEGRKMACIEVELRLVQLSFHIVARSSGVTSKTDTEKCCERVMRLCRQYPDTAGKFLKSYRNVERCLKSSQPLVSVYTADTVDVWRRWGRHVVGHLSKCKYGHPYSTATFDGCPDCGREVEVRNAPEPIDYESFMKNDEFLAQMRRAS